MTTTGATLKERERLAPAAPRGLGWWGLGASALAGLLLVQALAGRGLLGPYDVGDLGPLAMGFAVLAYATSRVARGASAPEVWYALLGGFFLVGVALANVAGGGVRETVLLVVLATSALVLALRRRRREARTL